jgi:hypothetical protein
LPRKTTTRVSSGWVASMSILLAICKSHEGRRAAHSVPERRRSTARCQFVGEGNGSNTPSAPTEHRVAGRCALHERRRANPTEPVAPRT